MSRLAWFAALASFALLAHGQTPEAGTAKSRDGTTIAYDKWGSGPSVVIVGGALSDRAGAAELAKLLTARFTVYTYDRRGRGDSGDEKPYAVEREIEDLDAVIEAAGGSALVYGKSSGAALALQAAAKPGNRIARLALYEPPYNEAKGAVGEWRAFRTRITPLLHGRNYDQAVVEFLKFVGAPDDAIAKMKASPAWAGMVAMAPTIAYDNVVLGRDRAVPVALAANVAVPTLVIDGGASAKTMPYMRATADKLGATIPNAKRRTIAGQAHDVSPAAIVPVLIEFFQ